LRQALTIDKRGLVLTGAGRGGKVRDEKLTWAALEAYVGKRARKGRAPDVTIKVTDLRPVLEG
jgi:topoisomerase-4 subunit A